MLSNVSKNGEGNGVIMLNVHKSVVSGAHEQLFRVSPSKERLRCCKCGLEVELVHPDPLLSPHKSIIHIKRNGY